MAHAFGQARGGVVQIWRDGTFRGSGFFVAENLVVTCSHVFRDGTEGVTVVCRDRVVAGEVLFREPVARPRMGGMFDFPDVAFVGLREPVDAPVRYLDDGLVEDRRQLEIVGFLEQPGQPGVSAAELPVEVTGTFGNYRAVDARTAIPGGLSGSPVIDLTTGHVHGMLKAGAGDGLHGGLYVKAGDIRAVMAEQSALLAAPITSAPLRRPDPSSWQHRLLVAQQNRARTGYPYEIARPSRRDLPSPISVYVERRTQRRAKPRLRRRSTSLRSVKPDVMTPEEMIRKHRNALVTGVPGSGKSTLLGHLVYQCADWWLHHAGAEPAGQEDQDGRTWLGPVLAVRCAATDLVGPRPWLESVAAAVSAGLGGEQNLTLPPSVFAEAPMPGVDWLLLVDGLDEIHDLRRREELIRTLSNRIAAYGSPMRIVIATRELPEHELKLLRTGLLGPAANARLGDFVLRLFDWERVEEFAQKWYRPEQGEHSAVPPEDFLRQVRSSGLQGVVTVPLLATIAALVYEESPTSPLPIDRAGLYEGFVDALLNGRLLRTDSLAMLKEHVSRHGSSAETFVNFLYEQRLACLGDLALHRMRGDGRPWPELLAGWLAEQDRRPPPGITQVHLREVLLSTGLLFPRGDDLAFIHQSFADYLAAFADAAAFDVDGWQRRIARDGPDSAGLFALAVWSRGGNDPLPIFARLLRWSGADHPDWLGVVAALIEDGGPLVRVSHQRFTATIEQGIRRMPVPADRALPSLDRVLRGVLQRTGDSAFLHRLAAGRRVDAVKRVEAARVLVESGGAADRAAGLRVLVRLAHEDRVDADDRLWALRTLGEVGGPDERRAAVQRMTQTVETTASEATRVRGLILLAGMSELPAATSALVRRGVDGRRSLGDRLGALETLGILHSAVRQDGRGWQDAEEYAGGLTATSDVWRPPRQADGDDPVARADSLASYAARVALAIGTVREYDPERTDTFLAVVMRDRALTWLQRVSIVRKLHGSSSVPTTRRALDHLAADARDNAANRVASMWLFADWLEHDETADRVRSLARDADASIELRREGLTSLMRNRGWEDGFFHDFVGDRRQPPTLRVHAALLLIRADEAPAGATSLLRDLRAEFKGRPGPLLAVTSASASLVGDRVFEWLVTRVGVLVERLLERLVSYDPRSDSRDNSGDNSGDGSRDGSGDADRRDQVRA
ncbi:trypsin-like peptidase domain-containing protein [Dactylosporangium sp. NPDC049742]|uniref:trypsin-like peptidase domain-containing protein n=1 Tax=Dactylosporangium sp. NPDC049742 TaxID=3154737 RepID=UPI003431C186